MKRVLAPFLAVVPAAGLLVALPLAGCSDGAKKTFGLEADPPDAFQVGTQPPLSLPPELGQLPSPNPGEPRPQQVDAAQQGADVISPENALASNQATAGTPGEQSFLDQAGPTPPGDIRATVNQQALIASKPKGFVNNLMGTPPTPPPTVDASAENRRLQENAALGAPVTQGDTPTNPPRPGFFQRVLNFFSF